MIRRLPDYYQSPQTPEEVPPYVPPMTSLSRPTASAINDSQHEIALTLAGFDQVIPVIYGEYRVNGLWLVRPYVHGGTGNLRFAILWSWGEIEGVQNVYLNGQSVSSGHMTHYVGTSSQTADTKLAADIAGFNDAYVDLAYTVFDIPAATYSGFPQTIQIEAVVRGIKVLDDRTSTTAWSENPALCFADWVRSENYGPGLTIDGVEDCADRCDSLVGGVEVRCEFGYSFSTPVDFAGMADLFAAYAECLWSYDGDGVLIVPDAPVVAPALTITTGDIVENTLRMTGEGLGQAPTEVTVTFRESSGGATQWPESSETVQLAGVDVGEVAAVRSDVNMPGVRRSSEANRKALMRLRRLQNPGRWAWQAFDDGVKFQRGDVIQLPDTRGMTSRVVRVMSIEMLGHGKYQITAEHYDDNMYPDDYTPGTTTTVPVGGILPYIGSGTPAGYSDFTAANGRFLVGAGSTWARGATFGSTSFTISGNTSTRPNHGNTTANNFLTKANFAGGAQAMYRDVRDAAGEHFHAYSVAQNREPEFVQNKLIVKTGTPGDVPSNAGFWADGAIISSAYEALSVHLGRLHKAGATNTTGGTQTSYSVDVGIQSVPGHTHASDIFGYVPDVAFPVDHWDVSGVDRGAHTHSSNISVSLSIPRKKLAHYVAGSDFEIVPGAIIGFNGDGALPAGWYDADGTNGTADTRDFWVERSTPGDAGATVAGTRQAVWSGTTGSGGAHDHKGVLITTDYASTRGAAHDTGEAHTHTVSGAVSYDPPSYAMRFVQYTGVV